jgi:hypothetical protein
MPVDVTHRRPRLNDKTDRLPYTKAAAHRPVRTTIGQELKALYEAPRDLPHEMATLLIRLSAPNAYPKG